MLYAVFAVPVSDNSIRNWDSLRRTAIYLNETSKVEGYFSALGDVGIIGKQTGGLLMNPGTTSTEDLCRLGVKFHLEEFEGFPEGVETWILERVPKAPKNKPGYVGHSRWLSVRVAEVPDREKVEAK